MQEPYLGLFADNWLRLPGSKVSGIVRDSRFTHSRDIIFIIKLIDNQTDLARQSYQVRL